MKSWKGERVTIKQQLETAYLCWFSRPKEDRELYRYVRKHRIRSIVELGVSSHQRCLRLIRLAKFFSPDQELRYSAVDLFDARPGNQPRMTLKQTHQTLAGCGATVRLIPGDALSGLSRCANQLQGTQLLLVSADQDAEQLAKAWMYVPRMLAVDAIVLVASHEASELRFQRLSVSDIDQLAVSTGRPRRAA